MTWSVARNQTPLPLLMWRTILVIILRNSPTLEKEGFLTARVINGGHGLRKPVPVPYQDLDVNGNKQPGMQEDGKTVGGAFVENTMKIYVKNPNIMLDKRVALDMESSGTGDNDGWPDYQGRSLPNQDGTGYESDYDDYAEESEPYNWRG